MIRIVTAAAALLFSASLASAAPFGLWLLPKGKGQVRVAECGGELCATIVSLKKPNDKQGRPKVDRKNPDPAKRSRPVVGLSLLTGMKPEGEAWKGRVYNPDDGRTYYGSVTQDGEAKLRLQGCIVSGLLCKTQVLTRID
jgi:uncharacterized protein (DUF2147 family)